MQSGDLMQLISVDKGWFFVELHRASEVLEGWVPSTYVERRWNVDFDKMSISKHPPGMYDRVSSHFCFLVTYGPIVCLFVFFFSGLF